MEFSAENSPAMFLTVELLNTVRTFFNGVVLPTSSIYLFYFTHWGSLDGPFILGSKDDHQVCLRPDTPTPRQGFSV